MITSITQGPSQCAIPVPLNSYTSTQEYHHFVWVTKSWHDACLLLTVDVQWNQTPKPCWLLANQTNVWFISNTELRSRLSHRPESELTGYRAGLNIQGGSQKRQNKQLFISRRLQRIHIIQVLTVAFYGEHALVSITHRHSRCVRQERTGNSLWRKGRKRN